MRSKAELAIDHRWTQRPLRRVVRRFDAFDLGKRPEPRTMLVKLLTHTNQSLVATITSAQQQAIKLLAKGAILF